MQSTMTPTFLLDRQGAARSLSVSLNVFDELVRTGQIPSVLVGKRLKFRPEDLAAFAERGTREPLNA